MKPPLTTTLLALLPLSTALPAPQTTDNPLHGIVDDPSILYHLAIQQIPCTSHIRPPPAAGCDDTPRLAPAGLGPVLVRDTLAFSDRTGPAPLTFLIRPGAGLFRVDFEAQRRGPADTAWKLGVVERGGGLLNVVKDGVGVQRGNFTFVARERPEGEDRLWFFGEDGEMSSRNKWVAVEDARVGKGSWRLGWYEGGESALLAALMGMIADLSR